MSIAVPAPPAFRRISFDALRHGVVWLLFASSFVVFIEPAPCDFLSMLSIVLFLRSGLAVGLATVPFVLFMLLFLLGGLISLVPFYGDPESVKYVFTSVYMIVSGAFFAFYLGMDAERRTALIGNGWIVGAFIASVLGIAGALDVAGTGALMSLQGRAQGLFKDPNVYSTYIILPAILLMQGIILGRSRHKVLAPFALLVILTGLFLSFSRGAWLNFILASLILVSANFLLEGSAKTRLRIVIIVTAGIILLALLMTVLLSIESVRFLFFDRLTLVKSYDGGETGRFGNQLNSIPVLMGLPNGFGPLQFRNHYGLEPHNAYINAFASYGWLGGYSYLLLVGGTVLAGFKAMAKSTPFQYFAIATTGAFIAVALQGVQIDTDHWRHFYWIAGMIWGLAAASSMQQGRA